MDSKWRHVLQWLKENGIHEVYDGSFGADICTYMHIQYLRSFDGRCDYKWYPVSLSYAQYFFKVIRKVARPMLAALNAFTCGEAPPGNDPAYVARSVTPYVQRDLHKKVS